MEDKTDFLWQVHAYTNEHIRFADTKAGIAIAWAGALLSSLVAVKAYSHILDAGLVSIAGFTSLLAFALLAGGFFVAVIVVAPDLRRNCAKSKCWFRRNRETQPGLIFWEAMREFASADEYRQAVEAERALSRPVSEHVYQLAGVAKRKFWWVSLSIWLCALGTLPTIIVIFAL